MDFAGFRNAALVVAILFAVAGVVSAVGIRNGVGELRAVTAGATAHCHDRATPPPAPTVREFR